ncbi:hypothetical protein Drorol1_Dr00015323 [Drosera rotundifolia]
MREQEELPSPDELMPISQTLITPDLALAFNIIPTTNQHNNHFHQSHHHHHSHPNPTEPINSSSSPEQDQARTLKRPRLVWTPQLHKRFVDAVSHLGIKNAVPKTIMQLMSVDGLTRENVASHLQKYRLYLKRVQGMSIAAGGGGDGSGGGGDSDDLATDRLFASSPVPAHFLHQAATVAGYVGAPVAGVVQVAPGQYSNNHGYYQGHVDHFAVSNNVGAFFDGVNVGERNNVGNVNGSVSRGFVDNVTNGRRVLTLFPTGDD